MFCGAPLVRLRRIRQLHWRRRAHRGRTDRQWEATYSWWCIMTEYLSLQRKNKKKMWRVPFSWKDTKYQRGEKHLKFINDSSQTSTETIIMQVFRKHEVTPTDPSSFYPKFQKCKKRICKNTKKTQINQLWMQHDGCRWPWWVLGYIDLHKGAATLSCGCDATPGVKFGLLHWKPVKLEITGNSQPDWAWCCVEDELWHNDTLRFRMRFMPEEISSDKNQKVFTLILRTYHYWLLF